MEKNQTHLVKLNAKHFLRSFLNYTFNLRNTLPNNNFSVSQYSE